MRSIERYALNIEKRINIFIFEDKKLLDRAKRKAFPKPEIQLRAIFRLVRLMSTPVY